MITHWKWYTDNTPHYSRRYEPLPKAPAAVMPAAKQEEHSQMTTAVADVSRDTKRLVFSGGACKEYFNCSDSTLKNLTYTILIDNRKGDVEQALKCRILVHERKRDEGHGLSIQVRS
jgi:hypothetical protein